MAHGEGLWYTTRDKQEASVWIHLFGIGMAEVKVCFVDGYGEAGWVRPHRLQGRFSL